jgi:hypothetical protein
MEHFEKPTVFWSLNQMCGLYTFTTSPCDIRQKAPALVDLDLPIACKQAFLGARIRIRRHGDIKSEYVLLLREGYEPPDANHNNRLPGLLDILSVSSFSYDFDKFQQKVAQSIVAIIHYSNVTLDRAHLSELELDFMTSDSLKLQRPFRFDARTTVTAGYSLQEQI